MNKIRFMVEITHTGIPLSLHQHQVLMENIATAIRRETEEYGIMPEGCEAVTKSIVVFKPGLLDVTAQPGRLQITLG